MAHLNDKKRALILADFHLGKSQHWLAQKYEVSSATINKLVKGLTPKNEQKVNDLTRIKIELAEQTEQEVNAVHKEVEIRTKDIEFYNSGQNFLAKVGLAKVRGTLDPTTGKPTENTTPQLLTAVSGVVSTSRQGVVGTAPNTVINNTNAQQVNTKLTYEVVR